jgi:hypothetical protein
VTTIDTRPDTYSYTVTSGAIDTIQAMHGQVQAIGRDWGMNSPEYRKAAESLAYNLSMLFGRPMQAEARVMNDGPLSLIVSSLLTFGINWSGTHRTCEHPDCHARIEDDGRAWTWSNENAPILHHSHDLSYPLTAAQPGTWSMNS